MGELKNNCLKTLYGSQNKNIIKWQEEKSELEVLDVSISTKHVFHIKFYLTQGNANVIKTLLAIKSTLIFMQN